MLVFLAGCASSANNDRLLAEVETIEGKLEARIDIVVIDEQTQRIWARNSEDHFPLTSTFKTLACAGLLAKVDRGDEQLGRRIVFQQSELVTFSPEMENRFGPPGVTLGDACEATLSTSDNTAANIVLDSIGGPRELTSFLRPIGDQHTRLDRYEPNLNEAAIGDERDTTTPAAMAATLKALLVDDEVLSLSSQIQLKSWLMGTASATHCCELVSLKHGRSPTVPARAVMVREQSQLLCGQRRPPQSSLRSTLRKQKPRSKTAMKPSPKLALQSLVSL